MIEDGMRDGDQELVISAAKPPLQGILTCLCYNAHAHPIPELFLGNPIFLTIIADNQCRFFDSHKFAWPAYALGDLSILFWSVSNEPDFYTSA